MASIPPARRRWTLAKLAVVVLALLAIPVVAYALFLAAAILIAPDWN